MGIHALPDTFSFLDINFGILLLVTLSVAVIKSLADGSQGSRGSFWPTVQREGLIMVGSHGCGSLWHSCLCVMVDQEAESWDQWVDFTFKAHPRGTHFG